MTRTYELKFSPRLKRMPPKNLIPPPRRRGIFGQVLVLFRNLATTLAISLYLYTVLSSAGKYCQQKKDPSDDKGQLCTFIRQNSNQWKTWTASAPPAFRSPVTDSKGQRAPLEMTLGVGGIPLVLSLYLVFLWVLGDANRVTQDTALVATTLIVVQNVFFASPVDSDALTMLAIALSFVLPIGRGSSGDVFSTLSVMYGFGVLAYASLQVGVCAGPLHGACHGLSPAVRSEV